MTYTLALITNPSSSIRRYRWRGYRAWQPCRRDSRLLEHRAQPSDPPRPPLTSPLRGHRSWGIKTQRIVSARCRYLALEHLSIPSLLLKPHCSRGPLWPDLCCSLWPRSREADRISSSKHPIRSNSSLAWLRPVSRGSRLLEPLLLHSTLSVASTTFIFKTTLSRRLIISSAPLVPTLSPRTLRWLLGQDLPNSRHSVSYHSGSVLGS